MHVMSIGSVSVAPVVVVAVAVVLVSTLQRVLYSDQHPKSFGKQDEVKNNRKLQIFCEISLIL